MSYQVLARKYRPKTFAEVVGQEHVTRTLKNALKQGRLAHAFLFTGPRGIGKTSTARILARAVNCPNVDLKDDAEPCNKCPTCQALLEDRELDVIEMDAASRTGVDDVRDIIESSRLSPVAGGKKIYIIDEVHMLSKNAFNAFLKTLEEPPSHVIFILATTDVHKVPATIRSRVQRYDFRPLGPADIAPHLKKICEWESFPCDDESLWIIARKADGSLRDAEGLLDQVVSFSGGRATLEDTRDVLGILPTELLARTTELIAAQEIEKVPAFMEMIYQRGVDYTEFLRALQSYWTDIVFLKQDIPLAGLRADEAAEMRRVSESLSIEDMFRYIRLAEGLEDAIKWSTMPRTRFEVALLRWTTLERVVSIKHLMDELKGGVAHAPPAAATARPVRTEVPAPPPPPPPTKQESETTSTGNGSSEVTLEALRSLWPQVVALLKKKSQAAGVSAESGWEIVSLEGRKITILCRDASEFAQETLRQTFPTLKSILAELTKSDFVFAAAKPTASLTTLTSTSATTATGTGGSSGELYNEFMDRIAGVEVDPRSVKERK